MDASTTTRSRYFQPALVGGAVMGVLSALPFISALNICCCLWVVTGGVVSAYILQQNRSGPITAADGAIVGLFAGLLGAVITSVISIPISLITGPMQQAMLQRLVDSSSNMPSEVRDALSNVASNGAMSGGFRVVAWFIGFCFMLFAGAIFSTLGGLLGVAIFAKKAPSTPPPTPSV